MFPTAMCSKFKTTQDCQAVPASLVLLVLVVVLVLLVVVLILLVAGKN